MFRITSLFALLLATSPAAVIAQDTDAFAIYGQSGAWTIYADNENKTCLTERLYDGGTSAMLIGADKTVTLGYLGVFSVADGNKPARKQKVKITIGGQTFKTTATGARKQRNKTEYSGGYIQVKDRDLAEALMAGTTMFVTPSKSDPFAYDITGLGEAVQVMTKCIQLQNAR